jgi:hypothetical protein
MPVQTRAAKRAAEETMTFKDCSVCYEKWKFNSHFLHLDIEYFEILRGRGGPSRSLEGGALNGNSSYK